MLTGLRWGGTPAMSPPSIPIRPPSGVSSPASRRNSVVLPQPEPPSSANSSPRAISRSTLSTATTASKRLDAPSILTMGSLNLARSSAGLDRRPQPGAFAGLLGRPGGDGVELGAIVGDEIDQRVLGDRLVHQRHRGGIAVGVAGEVARSGGDLGIEHEVDEADGLVGIGRVLGD